jgi:hypothetical protein
MPGIQIGSIDKQCVAVKEDAATLVNVPKNMQSRLDSGLDLL